jgi:mRNA interferase MazF
MPVSEDLKPFDVVVLPFPFSDRLAEKRRPAVIVSRISEQHRWLLVAMITSSNRERWPGDLEITDISGAGLPSASVVRTAKLATVETARLIRRIGSLDHDASAAVRLEIIARLGDPV